MATISKIIVAIDDAIIELKGEEKENFILDQKAREKEMELLDSQLNAKREARKSALEKLAEIAGLTKDEMAALGL